MERKQTNSGNLIVSTLLIKYWFFLFWVKTIENWFSIWCAINHQSEFIIIIIMQESTLNDPQALAKFIKDALEKQRRVLRY